MEETQSETTIQPRQSMNSMYIAGVVVLLVLGAGIFYLSSQKTGVHSQIAGVAVTATTAPTQASTSAQPQQKFQDSEFAKSAYKVFPGDVTADAKQALAGFDMQTKALSDGSTQVTLVAKKQSYTTQTVIVKPGDSLFFIERTLRDDNADEDEDMNLRDDSAILVDKDGYIVQ